MSKKLLLIVMVMLVVPGVMSVSARQDLCNVELETMTTADDVEFVRTPDACFENLPDWDYDPQYVEIDGLRQAYVDVGTGESGETILLLHGQPAWSYLYRRMIPVLAAEGHRVIAMDHVGMGRSDKPVDPDYYTYPGHVERLETFIQELELEQGNLTAFVQDWGSLIGLQVVGTNPDWFDRVVVGNGTLPVFEEGTTRAPLPAAPEITREIYHMMFTSIPAQQPAFYDEDGNQTISIADLAGLDLSMAGDMLADGSEEANGDTDPAFGIWMDYALNDERFRPEVIVEALTYYDLTDDEEAAYGAPFPTRITMGGVRVFPSLINQVGDVTRAGWDGLSEYDKPFLTIWGGNDPGNLGQPAVQQGLLDNIPGTDGWDHVRLDEASHFLQDDQGEEIARRVNEFISQTSSSVNAEEDAASSAPTVYTSEHYETQVTTRVYAQGLTHDEWGSETSEPMDLLLDVYEPIGAPGNRPAIIVIHGGAFRFGNRTMAGFVQSAEYFASRGWVAVSIDYREVQDRGTIPQEWQASVMTSVDPSVQQESLAVYTASRDAKAAVRWLYANAETYRINTDYMTAYGGSAGATLALMLGTTDAEIYRDELTLEEDPALASTNLDQPADIHTIIGFATSPGANRLLDVVYGINPYDETDAPILFVHGTEDEMVDFSEAEALRDQYEETGVPYEFYPVEGGEHNVGSAEINGMSIIDAAFVFIVEQQALQTED